MIQIRRFFFFLCLACGATSRAAAPVVQPMQLDSVVLGESITLRVNVTNPDGNLGSAKFYVSGPATRDPSNLGALSWPAAQLLQTATFSGAQASYTWQPPQAGSYMVTVVVANLSTTLVCPFETVLDRQVVPAMTVSNGTDTMIIDAGEIRTQENDLGFNIVVSGPTTSPSQPGGSLIFWSGGRIVLLPGFHATAGLDANGNSNLFWAAVDHNLNGLSDLEEMTSTAGDGIPDAWKVEHGLSIGTAYSQQYLAAYLGSYDPADSTATKSAPGGTQLVLKTPADGFYGVNTTTWAISSAN